MKRFSPYKKYQMNGKTLYTFIAPDGQKKTSDTWHEDRIREIRAIFHYFEFKKHQPDIIKSILSGHDTFVILPTGGGKSLCFQAPSLFFPGITLVVTPLTALIENQVNKFNLNAYPHHYLKGDNYYESVRFKAIYPGMGGLSPREMFAEIENPREERPGGRKIRYKFLYVSPERLCQPKFLRALKDAEERGLRIDHLVIDEVHCLSQWGFDFRESYLSLPRFIRQRPLRPIISAFTATATPKDIAEIKNLLDFPLNEADYEKKKYEEKFYWDTRENLSLNVIPCRDGVPGKDTSFLSREETLISCLEKNLTKVCVIYRTTAAGVDELYDTLKNREWLQNRLVKYHAQMPANAREKSKNAFWNSCDETLKNHASSASSPRTGKNIMIATKAFGMGIDKKDISLVIHYDMPRSLEDYYQEVGRAGRDSASVPKAECFLLYSTGPETRRGTLLYTANWVLSQRTSPDSAYLPISSRFSETMKENIAFWSYFRLCYMAEYCRVIRDHPETAHSFIRKYLKSEFTEEETALVLDRFHDFIGKHPLPPVKRRRAIEDSQGDFHKELRQLIYDVNELHMNNTLLANLLRHHPDQYRLNEPCPLPADGPASESPVFVLYGEEKPTYFDLCVLDAVYSIEFSQKETLYVQTIWEILSGRNPHYSSREKRDFREKIQSSIEKMRALSISLTDPACGFEITNQCFLPLTAKPQGQKGYSYQTLPPLFSYAEAKNGELIRVPVSLFNTARIKKVPLRPSVDHMLLCHYLLHRIAISRKRRRCKFIQFSTVKSVIRIREDAALFHKKTAAVLDFYRTIGYLEEFSFYIRDYSYQLADQTNNTDTVYFQWQSGDEVRPLPFSENRPLSGEAKRKLAALTLSRMNGIFL